MEPIPTPPNPFLADAGAAATPTIEELFFLPGDWLIYALSSRVPSVADMLQIGPGDYGSTLASVLSWISWIMLVLVAIAATSAIRRFDRAVTELIVDAVLELRRRIRMAVALARYRRKQLGQREPRTEPSFEVIEGPTRLTR